MKNPDYPTAKFYTFEDKIIADVNGRKIQLAVYPHDAGQEVWNLIKILAERASLFAPLADAIEAVQDWKGTRVGEVLEQA